MNLELFIDTAGKKFVKSSKDTTAISLPKFFQYAVVNLKIWLLEPDPDGGNSAPYSIIDPGASAVLRVAIGDPRGSSQPIAYQYTFAEQGDKSLTGTLNLATTEVNTLIGDELEVDTYIEVDYKEGTDEPDKIVQSTITLRAALIDGSTVDLHESAAVHIGDGDSPYTVPSDVLRVYVNTNNAPVTVNLPANSNNGRMALVQDETGAADVNPISVYGNPFTIAGMGGATLAIASQYGAYKFFFNSYTLASCNWIPTL